MATKTKSATNGEKAIPLPLDLTTAELTVVDVARIRTSPFQTREGGPSEAFIGSIRDDGLQEPPTVRPVPADENGCDLEMVKGHQRLAGVKAAGWEKIAVIIRELDDDAAFRLCVIENIQRQDLNPTEEARAFKLAQDRFGWSNARLASVFHRSPDYIKGRLDILELPDELRKLVADGFSLEKAKVLAPLGQFRRVKGGGPDIIAKLNEGDALLRNTNRDVKWDAERAIEENAVKISGWDPDICAKNGCLGTFGKAKYCLKPSHALEVAIAKIAPALTGAVRDAADPKLGVKWEVEIGATGEGHLVSNDKVLPVYYDLQALDKRRGYGRDQVEQPADYPAFPKPLFDKSYRERNYNAVDGKKFARPLKEVASKAKKKFAAETSCPSRAVYVSYKEDYRGEVTITAAVVSLSFAEREPIMPKEVKKTSTSSYNREPSAEEKAAKAAAEAAQPQLQEYVGELTEKLIEDPVRLFAAAMMERHWMNNIPTLRWEYDEPAQAMSLTIPEHDKTANGALKAVMSLGDRDLRRLFARSVLAQFDTAYEAGDGWGPEELAHTVDFLYGPAAAAKVQEIVATAAAAIADDARIDLAEAIREHESARGDDDVAGRAPTIDACHHGVGFDEECEDCAEEDDSE